MTLRSMPWVTGIDVSDYQPFVDWLRVANDGHAFAYVKASEGRGWRAKHFARHWKGAKAAGLLRGAYHFGRWEDSADVVADARTEAEWFFRVVGPLGPGDLPPILDLEWISGQSRNPRELVRWTRAFLERAEELFGRWPMLYTGPSFWRYCLLPANAEALELLSWPLWIVDYTGGPKVIG